MDLDKHQIMDSEQKPQVSASPDFSFFPLEALDLIKSIWEKNIKNSSL